MCGYLNTLPTNDGICLYNVYGDWALYFFLVMLCTAAYLLLEGVSCWESLFLLNNNVVTEFLGDTALGSLLCYRHSSFAKGHNLITDMSF